MATVGAVGTKSEFAVVIGRTKQYVSQLGRKGRLVLTSDGKVDFEASKRRIEETKRVDRQGVREHHARTRGQAEITPQPAIAATSPVSAGEGPAGLSATPPAGNTDQDDYNRARAQKEAAAAAMAEMELAKRRGELVEVGQVRSGLDHCFGIINQGFERIVPRIGPVWSVEQDPSKREQLLEDELRKVRQEWADAIAKLAGRNA